MDSKSSVGKKHIASARNSGLAISFAIHVFLGLGLAVLNTEFIKPNEFESLEEQSVDVDTLSADELQALITLLDLNPQVSEKGTSVPTTLSDKKNESRPTNLKQTSE